METKPIYYSKTFWLNVVVATSSLLALGELQALLGADALKYVVLVQAVLNVVMRLISSGSVSITGGPK